MTLEHVGAGKVGMPTEHDPGRIYRPGKRGFRAVAAGPAAILATCAVCRKDYVHRDPHAGSLCPSCDANRRSGRAKGRAK